MRTSKRAVFLVSLCGTVGAPHAMSAGEGCEPVLAAQIAQSQAERYSVKTSVSGKAGAEVGETMKTPEGMFVKRNGKWMKSPVQLTQKDRADLIEYGRKNISNCKLLGKGTLDGKAMAIYTYNQKAPNLPTSEIKLWIGKVDGLPHKLEVGSGDKDVTQTIDYSANIKAPK